MRRFYPILLGFILAGLSILYGLRMGASAAEGWQLAARYSARTSFFFFLIVYSVGPFAKLWQGAVVRNVLRARRYWGLAFAAAHGLHFAALTSFQLVSSRPVAVTTLIIGGFAYGMVLLLAVTSNNWAVRQFGVHWRALHRIGIHTIWFVFAASYLKRIFTPNLFAEGLGLSALAMVALLLRILAFLKARRRQPLLA
jgi:DMSO/TMAO reductase YedYZ heme-binding membrane subunit